MAFVESTLERVPGITYGRGSARIHSGRWITLSFDHEEHPVPVGENLARAIAAILPDMPPMSDNAGVEYDPFSGRKFGITFKEAYTSYCTSDERLRRFVILKDGMDNDPYLWLFFQSDDLRPSSELRFFLRDSPEFRPLSGSYFRNPDGGHHWYNGIGLDILLGLVKASDPELGKGSSFYGALNETRTQGTFPARVYKELADCDDSTYLAVALNPEDSAMRIVNGHFRGIDPVSGDVNITDARVSGGIEQVARAIYAGDEGDVRFAWKTGKLAGERHIHCRPQHTLAIYGENGREIYSAGKR